MRIFRYVLAHDGGMAPNPRGQFLSLATCKPKIRASAQVGDWVIGNRRAPHNTRVVWAGKVSQICAIAEYGAQYPERDDALYLDLGDGPARNDTNPWYHPGAEHRARDMAAPVLIFDWSRCWYFGEDARLLPDELSHLAATGIGHRVNGTGPGDAARLEAWLETQGRSGAAGTPLDGWDGACGGRC